MTRQIARMLLVGSLSLPAAAVAHEGHDHNVLGTIAALNAGKVQVKTQDGKTVAVTVDAKTGYERGAKKVDASAMHVGDRVVIDVGDGKAMLAKSVKLGAVK